MSEKSSKTKRCNTYLLTLPATRAGWAALKSLRKVAKVSGKTLVWYGRGSRKAAFEKRAKNPNAWEFGRTWQPWYNHHYRPKKTECTHFDVYVNTRRDRDWANAPKGLDLWAWESSVNPSNWWKEKYAETK